MAKKILLVEDEAIIALNETRTLQSRGFEVVTCNTGEKSVEAVREDLEISLVLMDIDLGKGIDGTEAAGHILELRELPIIFLTSHSEKEYVDKVRAITRYGYILKNSGEFVLRQSIQMAYELFEAKQEAQHHLEESLEANREMEFREMRLKHLNRVLLSIRGISRVITQETDKSRILNRTCRMLIETSGYHRAWIILAREGRPIEPFYHAGFKGNFKAMTEYLKKGGIPVCARRAMDENRLVVVGTPEAICRDCPFSGRHPLIETGGEGDDSVVMALPLKYGKELYGWISVILPEIYSAHPDEQRLFEEIGADITYALHNLRVRDEKEVADRSLAKSEERYRDLVENAPIGIFQTDSEGHALHVNPTMVEMVGGKNPEETVAHFQELAGQLYVRPEKRQEFLRLLKQDGRVKNFEYEAKREDGTHRWFSMNARISTELSPGNFQINGFTTDITRERRARESLRESERRLRVIINKLPIPILLSKGEEEVVISVNKKFKEIFGYTREDMPDVAHWLPLAYPDEEYREQEASEWRKKMDQARGKERELPDSSVRVRCKDGTERFVMIRAYSFSNLNIVVFQDFTEQQAVRERLETSLVEKDSLMQELNHRVKNNLVMITSLLSLKEASLGSSADLSDVRHQIEAIRIIHEKLFQSGTITRIDIAAYLIDLLDLIFSNFSEKKVRLDTDIEELLIETKSAIPLGLLVNEIAVNAVKYGFNTPEEPVFSISLKHSADQNELVMLLSNTGPPFPEDIELNNPDTLGLQLVTNLVDQLHGTISLRREPCPEFTIRFPMNSDRE